MLSKQELLKRKNDIINIASKHGAYDVRLFGSVARDEMSKDSDVDLLVKTQTQTSSWFPTGLILELETLLGQKVDVVTEKALHWYLRDRILKEAIAL